MLKKSFKTRVYTHSKGTGKLAIRLVGKWIQWLGFKEGDTIIVTPSKEGEIILKKKL